MLRLEFAKKHVSFGSRRKDVFSHEQKINLEVADGFRHCWYDLRKGKLFFLIN